MKSLLFIEPLYHQTVKGLKTQTRREGSLKAINDNPDEWERVSSACNNYDRNQLSTVYFWKKGTGIGGNRLPLKPRLLVGDIVRLNEPYAIFENKNTGQKEYKYRFDKDALDIPYKNKLFMPADAARAFVKITSVKCERLLDISDEDCIAEGIEEHPRALFKTYRFRNYSGDCLPIKARDSFFSLFKFANKIKADASIKNIWVWVYSYVLCDKDGKEVL